MINASRQDEIKFFENLLGCANPVSGEDLVGLVPSPISDGAAEAMMGDFTDDEIRGVVFGLKANKAPGQDGFNALFFQRAWPIIGEHVILAVKEFFRNYSLLGEINSTIITLVPKVANPSSMADFRPISCCNTLYKIISKLIANRIKGILPSIISHS